MEYSLYTASQRYSAGIYARLSAEREEGRNESIQAQLAIGQAFIQSQDHMELYDCYVDIGRSGTNFVRRGFVRMMEDVRMGRINCIIVKDFSRFGRNYIEMGNYLEKIFPFLGVRFIAVTDQFDSLNPFCWNSINTNLKNLVNEMYAKDIAIRVSTSKKEKYIQGSYVGGIAPYGYVAEKRDHRRILVEEKGTSDIVKQIYQLFLSGESIKSIRRWLYRQKIHTPMDYRRSGDIFGQKEESVKEWQQKTVKAILSNAVYTGSIKEQKYTHKGIIDEETFARAAVRLSERYIDNRETEKKKDIEVPGKNNFSGILYCGGCGSRLVRSSVRKANAKVQYIQYRCPKVSQINQLCCANNSISANVLVKLIKTVIQKEFALSGMILENLFVKCRKERESQIEKQKRTLERLEKRMEYIRRNDSRQYMRYRMGEQGKELFQKEKRNSEERWEILEKKRADIITSIKDTKELAAQREEKVTQLLTKGSDKELTKDIVQTLVCYMKVWQGQRVEVAVRFHNFL